MMEFTRIFSLFSGTLSVYSGAKSTRVCVWVGREERIRCAFVGVISA